jgi:D-glycero-D-manno-heptose 1,7-bisphosphate phosphatase
MHRGAIFLDRDGTINTEVEYLSKPEQIELIPRSADAIREARDLGFKIVIVTNQSGIARGFLTEAQLSDVHAELTSRLLSQNARIDGIYYCPHHPSIGAGPYRKDCDCRKPKPGLIVRAARELDIDLTRSFSIGDRMSDVLAGKNAGLTSLLVRTGYGTQELASLPPGTPQIDHVADDLYGAIQYVKGIILIPDRA